MDSQRTYLPGGRWRFVCIGRMAIEKGFDIVLRAAAALRGDFHITFIGEGPGLANLKALAQELGLSDRTAFWGHLPFDVMSEHLQDFDALIVASHAVDGSNWRETQCCVMQEAMLEGNLVVASRFGGIPGSLPLIFHEYLHAPGSVPELTERLRALMRLDAKMAWTLGAEAQDYVRMYYDIRKVNAEMLGKLEAMCDPSSRPSFWQRLIG